ncbi:hypothetical protein CYMTET_48215 [Cymbomonas tetramitiformis]|uniref:Uncharacterized protein n=1 Tax=Cymbomonas tetramitiformis TaxID=36881 RepID=A0AAE0BSR4_9CHLO|nr:hypothetical protein CYMTET_48215 [Cymbomonas tetramitiformis]
MPAAGSAAHTFIAAMRTLHRSRFDDIVAKHVQKKCFGDEHVRFTGTENNATTVFTRLMGALEEAFIADAAFHSLFSLTNATVTVRVEANTPLFSTLELLVDPEFAAADCCEDSSRAADVTYKHDNIGARTQAKAGEQAEFEETALY